VAGSRRIPDLAPPSWDPLPLFGDPEPGLGDRLEFCSAMSLLVITHHNSHKYAFKTFLFQHVSVVVFTHATHSISRGLCRRKMSVRLSHCSIASKWIKISFNVLGPLVAQLLWFLTPCADTQFQGEPI